MDVFRSNSVARNEREKAELRDRLEQERIARERAEKALREAQKTAEEAALEKRLEPGWFRETLDGVYSYFENRKERRVQAQQAELEKGLADFRLWPHSRYAPGHSFSRPRGFFGTFFGTGAWWKFGIIGLMISAVLFLIITHELYDIREGYVTDKTYTPGYWSETCSGSGSERSCSSTYHPPTWSIQVSYDGDAATWGVSQSDYNNIRYGQWACMPGFDYRCHGEPRDGEHFGREHYTLSGEHHGR